MKFMSQQNGAGLQERLGRWIESPRVQQVIVALILINAVTLGLETSSAVMERVGGLLVTIDRTLLAVFVAEILVKLYAFGWRFFRNPGTCSTSSWSASRSYRPADPSVSCASCAYCA
jgi:hypothetical protein